MKKQFYRFIMIALATGSAITSCHDDPKPDPCKANKPASARFTIGEHITNYSSGVGGAIKVDTVIVSDTVLNEQQIVFEALDENDSYEWKIGEDPTIRTTKKVSLWFDASSGGFTLPYTTTVRLITRKQKSACFPDDDGIDTVKHIFTIIDRSKNPIVGIFNGSLKSNTSDGFAVTISYEDNSQSPGLGKSFVVANLPKGCVDKKFYLGNILWGTNKDWWWAANNMTFGYRCMNFANDSGGLEECKKISGWIFIDEAGDIRIPYSIISDNLNDKTLIKEVFTGHRAH
jgi:hypothetical protein